MKWKICYKKFIWMFRRNKKLLILLRNCWFNITRLYAILLCLKFSTFKMEFLKIFLKFYVFQKFDKILHRNISMNILINKIFFNYKNYNEINKQSNFFLKIIFYILLKWEN